MKTLKGLVLVFLLASSSIFMASTSGNSEFHPNTHKTGNISAAEFKAQLGLIAWLDNFDFDAKCTIDSYTLYYTPKRKDAVTLHGKGGTFKGKMNQVIKQAESGDQYAFVNVKARCPGDIAARKVNSLFFKIR